MLLIKNAHIYTMEGKDYENGSILIEDGKIKKIAETIEESSEMEIIDAKGNYLFPGFIDAHTHLGLIEESMGFEGDDINEITNPATPELRAIDAINPMDESFLHAIKSGVTTVMAGPGSANVVGGQFAIIKTFGRSIDDMIIDSNAAMKVAFGENPKRCYGMSKKSPSTRMATAALLRQALVDARNYKNKKEKALEKNEPFDINLKWEPMIPVLEKKIPIKAHAHRADDILTSIRIAKEFDVKITLDHCTEGHLIADYIKEADVPVIIGPTMIFKHKVEMKNKSFETPKFLYEKGIPFAIMTDHPGIEQKYLPLCVALYVKEGLPKEEGLKAITINAAKILGLSHRIGSIKEGKDADLVLFDGCPLEIFTNTLYTIIDGKVVYKK